MWRLQARRKQRIFEKLIEGCNPGAQGCVYNCEGWGRGLGEGGERAGSSGGQGYWPSVRMTAVW